MILQNKKSWIRKSIDFALTFVLVYFSSISLHEFFHSNIARMLGYSPKVTYTWLGGLTWVQVEGALNSFLIGIMGGVGVGIIFLLIDLMDTDKETSLALKIVAIIQIVYGIIEGLWFSGVISL